MKIELSIEPLTETFRHFSRKELCQQISLVNRQFHTAVNSYRQVPVVHIVEDFCLQSKKYRVKDEELYLYESQSENKPIYDKTVGIGDSWRDYHTMPVTYILKQMAIPGPFIRFSNVSIARCQEKPMLKFLEKTSKSFIGCKLKIGIRYSVSEFETNSVPTQVHFFLQNVFRSPLWVSITDDTYWKSDTLQTKGVSNCQRLELQYSYFCGDKVSNQTIVNWLKNGRNQENGVSRKAEKRHLILREYPMRLIRDLVKQIKQDFSSDTPSSSDFLVTFYKCRENKKICFEHDWYQFTLDRTFTEEPKTERLSLFVQNINSRIAWPDEEKTGQIYRLWRRQVVNEETDTKIFRWLATDTHELNRFPQPDFDHKSFDQEFYTIHYPEYGYDF